MPDLPVKKNFSWTDKLAMKWLREHRHEVAVIDCDKGLGDALVPRSLVEELVGQEIPRGFTPVTCADISFGDTCRQEFRAMVQEASLNVVIPPATCRFSCTAPRKIPTAIFA